MTHLNDNDDDDGDFYFGDDNDFYFDDDDDDDAFYRTLHTVVRISSCQKKKLFRANCESYFYPS